MYPLLRLGIRRLQVRRSHELHYQRNFAIRKHPLFRRHHAPRFGFVPSTVRTAKLLAVAGDRFIHFSRAPPSPPDIGSASDHGTNHSTSTPAPTTSTWSATITEATASSGSPDQSSPSPASLRQKHLPSHPTPPYNRTTCRTGPSPTVQTAHQQLCQARLERHALHLKQILLSSVSQSSSDLACPVLTPSSPAHLRGHTAPGQSSPPGQLHLNTARPSSASRPTTSSTPVSLSGSSIHQGHPLRCQSAAQSLRGASLSTPVHSAISTPPFGPDSGLGSFNVCSSKSTSMAGQPNGPRQPAGPQVDQSYFSGTLATDSACIPDQGPSEYQPDFYNIGTIPANTRDFSSGVDHHLPQLDELTTQLGWNHYESNPHPPNGGGQLNSFLGGKLQPTAAGPDRPHEIHLSSHAHPAGPSYPSNSTPQTTTGIQYSAPHNPSHPTFSGALSRHDNHGASTTHLQGQTHHAFYGPGSKRLDNWLRDVTDYSLTRGQAWDLQFHLDRVQSILHNLQPAPAGVWSSNLPIWQPDHSDNQVAFPGQHQ